MIRKILKEKQCINVPIDELMKPTKIYIHLLLIKCYLYFQQIFMGLLISLVAVYMKNIKRIIKSDQDLKIIKMLGKNLIYTIGLELEFDF